MAIREGRWDCPTCGGKGILGRHKVCGNCGSPRPEGIEFYLPEESSEVVTDEAMLKTATAGADWICDYCAASNLATADSCKQCFAPRSADVRRQAVRTLGAQPQAAPSIPVSAAPGGRTLATIALFLLAAMACIYFAFIRTEATTAVLSDKSWDRTVEVLALQPVQHEGWDVPQDARIISQEEALYENRRVQVGEREYVCGQRDLGNGFFEDVICTDPIYQEDPVYRTRYTYEVDEWAVVRTEEASSALGVTPFWPQLSLNADEQQGETQEQYQIEVTASNGENYLITVPFDVWQRLSVGQEVEIEINAIGGASLARDPP